MVHLCNFSQLQQLKYFMVYFNCHILEYTGWRQRVDVKGVTPDIVTLDIAPLRETPPQKRSGMVNVTTMQVEKC